MLNLSMIFSLHIKQLNTCTSRYTYLLYIFSNLRNF